MNCVYLKQRKRIQINIFIGKKQTQFPVGLFYHHSSHHAKIFPYGNHVAIYSTIFLKIWRECYNTTVKLNRSHFFTNNPLCNRIT